MHKIRSLLLGLFVLSACVPIVYPPYRGTCEDIALTKFRPFLGKELPSDFQSWIAEAYDLPLEDVRVREYPNFGAQYFSWSVAGLWHYQVAAHLTEEKSAIAYYIGSDYGPTGPSGDEVIACLGEPDSYRAFYSRGGAEGPPRVLSLSLFFHDEGLSAWGQKGLYSSEQEPPLVDGGIRFFSIAAVAPGSAEEILRTIEGDNMPEDIKQLIQQLKPWPGSWDKLVVDIDPSLQN